MSSDELSNIRTMRDVFDYCTRNNLLSVAQGMIELPPPQKLRQLVSDLVLDPEQQNVHQYRNRFGEKVYLDAIQHLLDHHYKTKVENSNLLATAGVTGAIVSTLLTLRDQGKTNIALIEPFYTYHARQVEEVYRKSPTFIKSNDDFSPNFENIERSFKDDGTNAIIFCNPGNPHGRCWTKEEIIKITLLAVKYNALLIVDEIYCDMVFHPEGVHYSPASLLADIAPLSESSSPIDNHYVICRGFSKTLGAQSWRLGYAISSKENIVKIMSHHDPIYISVSWQQHALAKYLNIEYQDFVDHIAKINVLLRSNWKILAPAFETALGWKPIEPTGSMYGMFRHQEDSDFAALQKGLKYGVGVAPASMFFGGSPAQTGFIRIHVGMKPDTALAIAAILNHKN